MEEDAPVATKEVSDPVDKVDQSTATENMETPGRSEGNSEAVESVEAASEQIESFEGAAEQPVELTAEQVDAAAEQEALERRAEGDAIADEARAVLGRAKELSGEGGEEALYAESHRAIDRLVDIFEGFELTSTRKWASLTEARDSYRNMTDHVMRSIDDVDRLLDPIERAEGIALEDIDTLEGVDEIVSDAKRKMGWADSEVLETLTMLHRWAQEEGDSGNLWGNSSHEIMSAINTTMRAMEGSSENLDRFVYEVEDLSQNVSKFTDSENMKVENQGDGQVEAVESVEAAPMPLDFLNETSETAKIARNWLEAGAPFTGFIEAGGDVGDFRYRNSWEALESLANKLGEGVDNVESEQTESESVEVEVDADSSYAGVVAALETANMSVDELLGSVDTAAEGEPTPEEAVQTEEMWMALMGEAGPGAKEVVLTDDGEEEDPWLAMMEAQGREPELTVDQKWDAFVEQLDAEKAGGKVEAKAEPEPEASFEDKWDAFWDEQDAIFKAKEEEGLEEIELDEDEVELDTRARPAEFAGEFYAGDEEENELGENPTLGELLGYLSDLTAAGVEIPDSKYSPSVIATGITKTISELRNNLSSYLNSDGELDSLKVTDYMSQQGVTRKLDIRAKAWDAISSSDEFTDIGKDEDSEDGGVDIDDSFAAALTKETPEEAAARIAAAETMVSDDPFEAAVENIELDREEVIDVSTQIEISQSLEDEILRPETEKSFFGKVRGWMAGRAIGLMTFGISESIQAKKFESATKDEAERLEDVMNSLEGLGPMAQEWREMSGDTRSLNEIYSENAAIVRNEINQSVQNLEARLLESKRMMGLVAGPYKDQFGQKVMAMEARVNDFKARMEEQFDSELNADKALTEHKMYVGLDENGERAPRPSEVLITKKEFRGEMRKALDKTWWHRKVYSALEKIPWMVGVVALPGIAEAPTLAPGIPEITPPPDLIPDTISRNLDGSIWNTVKKYALDAGVSLDSSQLVELSKQVSVDNMVDVPVWDIAGGSQLHTQMEPQMIVLDAVDTFIKNL